MNSLTRINSMCLKKQLIKLSRPNCLITAIKKNDYSAQAAEAPLDLPRNDKVYPDKLKQIVTDISKLTLLEVADLNELLKKTLNIPDAPMMSMAAMPAGAQANQPAAQEEEEEIVKSAYIVKMVKFEPTKKVALIKEIKTLIEGMNLVQAKKFVESVPQVIKTEVPKDEAEKLKSQLEAAGATVVLV